MMRIVGFSFLLYVFAFLGVNAAKIPLGSKYFCLTDNEEYTLTKAKQVYSDEEANAIIEKLDTTVDKLQTKALTQRNVALFSKLTKKSLLAFDIYRCINEELVTEDSPAPDFVVHDLERGPHPAFSVFAKFVDVFGVRLYATDLADEGGLVHAANILAEYLDNDGDGIVDNEQVVETMRARNSAMIVFNNPQADEYEEFFDSFIIPGPVDGLITVGEVHTDQMFPNSAAYDAGTDQQFDATLEEVFHLITHEGYAVTYPKIFAEKKNSTLGKAMLAARESGHYNPFANDPNLDFGTQCTEYIYWAMTSILGAQDYEGRLEAIQQEWSLSTRDQVADQDPTIYQLLIDSQYSFPATLPTGGYGD